MPKHIGQGLEARGERAIKYCISGDHVSEYLCFSLHENYKYITTIKTRLDFTEEIINSLRR